MDYQHIIWDWNGTLFDDARLCVDITNELLTRRNLPLLTHERYQEIFDFPVRVYYERLGFDLADESFESLGTEFIQSYEQRRFECNLQEGVPEVLRAVAEAGLSQSILSAYQQERLEEMVDHFEMRDFFIGLVGLDDHYAAGKLDSGKYWMDELHCTSADVLMVGDTVHDYDVARELGADCVLIPSGHHPRSKLERCDVPLIASLNQFLEWMKGDS